MIRLPLIIFAFASLLFFPWPFSAFVALISSFFVPFLPLAIGLFADTLYYTPKTEALPLLTFYGAIATGIILFVRSRLATGSMKNDVAS